MVRRPSLRSYLLAGCAGVSRIQTLSTAARVGICIGITVAAWVAFVVIVGSLVAARRR